jgi:hypothetical protein
LEGTGAGAFHALRRRELAEAGGRADVQNC